MKNKIICIAFFLFGLTIFADIRDAVCIVRPNYEEKTLQFMDAAAGKISKAGYIDIAELFENAKEGVFGSGFFIRGHNKKTYVLTNYHVAAYASSLSLELENIEGEKVKIENCPVVAIDEELDIAIAEVNDKRVKSFLNLATKLPSDGVDVWSAGYPGLGGKPLWQLGKGTVTNSKTRLSNIVDPKKSFFIQHSAPIDSGNSGGPLLIKSQNSPEGYDVIGINSVKAVFRQSTNFAIPAVSIKNFIDSRVFGGKEKSENNLKIALDEFAEVCKNFKIDKEDEKNEEILKRLRKITICISEDYAVNEGLDAYLTALRKAPRLFRSEILSASFLGNPINGIRTAIAYEIYNSIKPEENSYIPEKKAEFADLKNAGKNYEFVLYYEAGKSKFFTVWNNHQTAWQITASNLNTPPDEKPSGKPKKAKQSNNSSFVFIEEIPTKTRIHASYIGLKQNKEWLSGFSFGYFHNFKYAEVGISAIINKPRQLPSFSFRKPLKICFGLTPEFRLQIPLNINNSVYIAPQAFVGAGIFIPPVDYFVQYGGGMEIVPVSFSSISFGVDFIIRSYLKEVKETNMGIRASISVRI
ncbi:MULTISPECIES: S1C family serine protease [unclassified Treponema]|uniref:S1C family serine protease n=1 Tax=unclassified Treponema TaxID=2638727 RepID=UPI0020A28A3C|nr:MULTISPECIES: S1C family serine protease [unclassified Treponema]UTC66285.1 serine protease [Treponema sp. OMZ 789]UTC69015.1 serine protease [Treponema sp. OMZ 790]UTC71727.1 serine protease [Treponema sp. OMZ 791]